MKPSDSATSETSRTGGTGFSVRVLASGSAGNCIILNDVLALDMGVSFRTIEPFAGRLKVVFVSHRHADHLRASTVLRLAMMRPALRFAAGREVAGALADVGVSPLRLDTVGGRWLHYPFWGLRLRAEPLRHDVPNYCLHIESNAGTCFYAVDTKNLNGIHARNYDLYLVEANYGKEEILERIRHKEETGEPVYEYRVMETHMSEETATAWLADNMGPDSQYMFIHRHGGFENGSVFQ